MIAMNETQCRHVLSFEPLQYGQVRFRKLVKRNFQIFRDFVEGQEVLVIRKHFQARGKRSLGILQT